MELTSHQELNRSFLKLTKRAETSDRNQLVNTFVDEGYLFTLLSSPEHQVIYGRRGTGKTHALLYLAETVSASGSLPVYLDMRTVGSTGGLYADAQLPFSERATRLLMDTLSAIHEAILTFSVNSDVTDVNLSVIGPLLDEFATAITQVTVSGEVEIENASTSRTERESSNELGLTGGPNALSGRANSQQRYTDSTEGEIRQRNSGTIRHRVHFEEIGGILARLVRALPQQRIWLLLDEWSVIPIELQPYLADLLRRSVFPVREIVVKIGAIEQRSSFRISRVQGDYIGIELGADASADLNLDDFMVFENDADRATSFFQELLFRHIRAVLETEGQKVLMLNPYEFVRQAFTQRNTFDEFVRAVEGVPRDAINIIALAAQKAFNNPISISDVRTAAKTWYQRDKEAAVSANLEARDLLHWIVDEVIAHRRARAFLLEAGIRHELIDSLFDARVLHLLKKNISALDQPGRRYDAYKIDFGCYVDLLITLKAPLGLLPENEGTYLEVPPDDYRAIRRAILNLDSFSASRKR